MKQVKIFNLLLMTLLLIITMSIVAFAQAQDPRFVSKVSSKVLSVDGNIIHLSGGVTVDLSESKFTNSLGDPVTNRPTIAVGNIVSVQGLVLSEIDKPIFIKCSSAIVETGKELFYWGLLQSVKAKKNTITVLNQKITVEPNARIIDEKGNNVTLSSIKKGDKAEIMATSLTNGLSTNSVMKYKGIPTCQLTGFVKSINGAKIELESGLVFDITKVLDSLGKDDAEIFSPKNFNPGTEIIIGLSDKTAMSPPQGVISVDGAFGFSRAPITIDAKLQAVDSINKTITVLNHKISLPDTIFIEGTRGKITINQLIVGKDIMVFADLNDAEILPKFVSQPFIN